MQNPTSTIISQYANSPIIVALVNYFNQYFDPSVNITSFYNNVMNVQTATGYGLDVWGRIVGVNRNQIPAYAPLSDSQFRSLILFKALANITNCTAPSLNTLLQTLFAGRGRCYVLDNLNMTIQYTFEFLLQPYELALMTTDGIFPRPVGVEALIVQIVPPQTFGFANTNLEPFGQGTLYNGVTYVS